MRGEQRAVGARIWPRGIRRGWSGWINEVTKGVPPASASNSS